MRGGEVGVPRVALKRGHRRAEMRRRNRTAHRHQAAGSVSIDPVCNHNLVTKLALCYHASVKKQLDFVMMSLKT